MKTASTYLRRCFTAATAALEERGIHYGPKLTDPGNKLVHMLIYESIVHGKGSSVSPMFARINQGDRQTVLLSGDAHIAGLNIGDRAAHFDAA